MIKTLLFILFFFSTCVLLSASSPQFSLKTTNGEPFELLELKTKALVEGPYAEVQYIQTYKNPLNHIVETNYHFPRTESSIFHKFEAVFQNQTIVGKIMEKETAKRMYDWNVRRGNTVAYSGRSQVAPDIMNIKVGNIPANETVEIIFSVIQPLETIINKFYELKLPVVLTERYSPAYRYSNHHDTPNIQTVDSKASLYKNWNIEVEIKSNAPFAMLTNPSHLLKPELSEKPSGSTSKIYKAVWNATIIPTKDFTIYFGPEKLEKPETILATSPQDPNNHVLLVNFVPDLTTIQPQVAQKLLETRYNGVLRLKRMAYQYDIEHAQAEFIFVIDRSGSMEGARIVNLRKALAKYLSTIPKTSYFNIISFGSSYQLYRPQSILNNPQALEEALQWVNTIQADMGGTEILQALRALSDREQPHTDLPKIIMILTDGDVFNPNEVINHISANANKMRFCSVGIGSGASDYLVRNMAKAGKCRSEFVQDHEDIGDKALYMVQAAISQYITDVRFDISCFNDQNQKVYSDKAELDLLLKDQAFSKWIYLENIANLRSCQASLTYYNSLKGKRVTEEMDIQRYELEEITDFWHKIAYDAKIKQLEQMRNKLRTWSQIMSQIIELSTKYQVLSSYTSFLAVLQENTVNPDEQAQQINIPNMRSADYTANQVKEEKAEKVEEKLAEFEKAVKIEEVSHTAELEKIAKIKEKLAQLENAEEIDQEEDEEDEEDYGISNYAGLSIDIEINANVKDDTIVDINADHACYSCNNDDIILNVNTDIEINNLILVNTDEFYEDSDDIEIDDNVDLNMGRYYVADTDTSFGIKFDVDIDDSYLMMDFSDDLEVQTMGNGLSQTVEFEKTEKIEEKSAELDKAEEESQEDEEYEEISNYAGLSINITITTDVKDETKVDIIADHQCSSCDGIVFNNNGHIEVENLLAVNADEFCEGCDNVNLGIEVDDNVHLNVDLHDEFDAGLLKDQEEKEEDSKTNQNTEAIQAGWDCENVDNAMIKECSGEESKEENIEKEEAGHSKLTESSDLKFINETNHILHANRTQPVISLISDDKEPENLQENANGTSTKDLADHSYLRFTGVSFIILLLSALLS